MKTSNRSGETGFSIIEMIAALTLLVAVVGVSAAAVCGSIQFTTHNIGGSTLQDSGRRALDGIRKDLARSGWTPSAEFGIPLPHVFSNGEPDPLLAPAFEHDVAELTARAATFPAPEPASEPATPQPFVAPGFEREPLGIREIVFAMPEDADGDGRPVTGTGEIEWSTRLYAYILVPDGRGTLNLVRRVEDAEGAMSDVVVCRHVDAMTFDTADTKGVLPRNAVEVHIHLRRSLPGGQDRKIHLFTTVFMRNCP